MKHKKFRTQIDYHSLSKEKRERAMISISKDDIEKTEAKYFEKLSGNIN